MKSFIKSIIFATVVTRCVVLLPMVNTIQQNAVADGHHQDQFLKFYWEEELGSIGLEQALLLFPNLEKKIIAACDEGSYKIVVREVDRESVAQLLSFHQQIQSEDESQFSHSLQDAPMPTTPLMTFCCQEELGSISVDHAKSLSQVFKAQLESLGFCKDRYKTVFRDTDLPKKEVVEFFVEILALSDPSRNISLQRSGQRKFVPIAEPGTSESHALLTYAQEKSTLSVTQLLDQKRHLMVDLYQLLNMYDISDFNQEICDVLLRMLVASRNDEKHFLSLDECFPTIAQDIARYIALRPPFSMISMHKPEETVFHVQDFGVARDFLVSMQLSSDCERGILRYNNFLAVGDVHSDKNAATSQQCRIFRGAMRLSPDGRYAIHSSADSITVFETQTEGQVLACRIGMIAFCQDSRYFAVAGDGEIDIFDLCTKQRIATLKHGSYVLSLRFSADGQRIIVVGGNDCVKIFDIHGSLVCDVYKKDHSIGAYGYEYCHNSSSGLHIVVDSDVIVRVYDSYGNLIVAIPHARDEVARLCGVGEYVCVESKKTIQIFDMRGRQVSMIRLPISVLMGEADKLVSVSPDGNYVIVGDVGITALFDIRGNLISTNYRNAQFHPKNQELLYTPNGTTVCRVKGDIGDMETDKILAIITLVQLVLDSRCNGSTVAIELYQDGWLYKVLMQLSQEERDRLQEQFPEISAIIANYTVNSVLSEQDRLECADQFPDEDFELPNCTIA